MQINDILFRITKALSLTTDDLVKLYALAEYDISEERIESILKRRQDKEYKEAGYEDLGLFLDGLVLFKRGISDRVAKEDDVVDLTNNLIMKKLRVALELKEPELVIIFALADTALTKRQIGALFRKEGTKNFKSASDELLMAFIEGLDEFYYDGVEI